MPDYQRYERETKCPLFDSPLSVTANIARTPIIIHKHNSPEHHITVIQAIWIALCHRQFSFSITAWHNLSLSLALMPIFLQIYVEKNQSQHL